MNDPLAGHLRAHFRGLGITAEPQAASVTFVGVQPMDVLRFGPDEAGVFHHATLGCSRHPMADPSVAVVDPVCGPRAELVLSLRGGATGLGLARSLAVIAATPAVEGVVLVPDLLVDLGSPLWQAAPFTAVLLHSSDVPDLALEAPRNPVCFLAAVPITSTEAAWVRLKGPDAMRQAWADDGVDVLDPNRRASRPVDRPG